MSQIVECVPNFSEGRDKVVIERIADAIRSTPGVSLLDVDPGQSTNRTVYTFVGSPSAVVEAALNSAVVASELIDMSKHKGEHPRLGAMDVCPFVPVRGVSEADCVRCAEALAERLAGRLQVPVFLYGAAARREERRTVPQVRAGEYEGLQLRLKDQAWAPDHGPARFDPRWGASIVGVRKFLIAYNVNIIGTKEQAHRIALNIRSQGRGEGQEGRLRCVQGMGWWLSEANMAQVSLNLTDHHVTPIHTAYEEVRADAAALRVAVAGSEIVGLVPLDALLAAAEYYIERDGLMVLEEDQKVRLAVSRLGLSALAPFNPKDRVIEYRLPAAGPLMRLPAGDLLRAVAARSAAPGGGSVSALVGALGAALATMVGQMTYGKKQWDHVDAEVRRVLPPLHAAVAGLAELVDADTNAFSEYMEALRLPSGPERERALQAGLRAAVSVPLGLARRTRELWGPLRELAEVCNMATASDLQVGARCLETAVWGAYHNVLINLRDISDGDFTAATTREAEQLVRRAQDGCQAVLGVLERRRA